MATTGSIALNLADIAKRMNPDDSIADVIELLNQTNDVLDDMLWMEGNLPVGHRVTVRTGLPVPAWRLLNGGVAPSKSTTAQLDEQCGLLEAFSQVDVDVAKLAGDVQAVRLSEAKAFIEGINQTMIQTLFYGDTSVNPERFLGLAPRFNAISGATNGVNVLSAAGSGSDNTSVWLVAWGDQSITGIYPKGSTAGLFHEDIGIETVTASTGIAGSLLRAYRDHWQWKCGIALKDWRYVCRIANIDVSDLVGSTGTQNAQQLLFLMSRAIDRIPFFGGVKPVFYMNRTVFSLLRVQALQKSNAALAITPALKQFGTPVEGGLQFMGIPIRRVDQILNTEATVS